MVVLNQKTHPVLTIQAFVPGLDKAWLSTVKALTTAALLFTGHCGTFYPYQWPLWAHFKSFSNKYGHIKSMNCSLMQRVSFSILIQIYALKGNFSVIFLTSAYDEFPMNFYLICTSTLDRNSFFRNLVVNFVELDTTLLLYH